MTAEAGPALAGHVALVTGSSRNIGRAIALRLAEQGANVVVNARSSGDEVDSVVAKSRSFGVRATGLLIDVRDQAAFVDGLERVRPDVGLVDVLVNCAANRPETRFDQMSRR